METKYILETWFHKSNNNFDFPHKSMFVKELLTVLVKNIEVKDIENNKNLK